MKCSFRTIGACFPYERGGSTQAESQRTKSDKACRAKKSMPETNCSSPIDRNPYLRLR
ncbi:hypothetical protein EVA_01372 [gut metagenome]|uniref:Uncharacterized protein n=1 Tax=gut metagenome TaxID=749906 RepID=J9DBT7_9ZZZZ